MQSELVFVRFFMGFCLFSFLLAFAYGAVRLRVHLAAAVAKGFKEGWLMPVLACLLPRKPDAMDLRVKTILRQRRIERMVLAAQIMLAPFCAILVLNMFRLSVHQHALHGHEDEELDLALFFCGSGLWASFYAFQACLIIIFVPRASSHTGVSLLHCFAVASTSLTVFFNRVEDTYYLVYIWSVLGHLFMNVIDGELWLVAPLNAAFAVVSAYTAVTYLPGRSLLGSITHELTVFCITHGATHMIVSSREAMLRATLDAKMSRSFRSASTSLLSSVCDVVVNLNSALEIADPSPQLAAFLLRPAAKDVMKGLLFLDLLQNEDDKKRFQDSARRSDDVTQVIHTQFKDANNTAIKVHLYHTQCLDVDDQPFHMIGIQEDDPVHRSSENRDEVPDTFDCTFDAATTMQWSRPIADDISLTSSDIAVSELPTEQEAGISVWFDASSNAMEVLKCTPGFAEGFGGVYRKRPLLSCLRPIHEVKFMSWMQHAVNRAWHDLPVQEKTFRFACPQRTMRLSASVCLDAGARLDGYSSGLDDSSDHMIDVAKLILTPLGDSTTTNVVHDLEQTIGLASLSSLSLDAMVVTPCSMYERARDSL